MKRLRSHIIFRLSAIILAVLLLMSTSGFTVYSHHCSHKQIHYYSIILPVDNCSCQSEESMAHSCCQSSKITAFGMEQKECCSNHEKFSKLIIPGTFSSTSTQLQTCIWHLSLPLFANINQFETCETDKDLWHLNDPPPPLVVHEYLSKIQVYLL